jgi:nitrate/nitrite transporter NarK
VSERTVGQLVADTTREVSELLRYEVALAKAELAEDAKRAGVGAGMFGGAGFLGAIAFVLLCVAAAFGLNEGAGWPLWLSFLVVAVVLLVIAGVLALVGRKSVSKVGPPQRTIETSKQTVAAVKGRR